MRTSRVLIASIALTAVGAFVPAAVSAAPAKAKPKCYGKTATIVATGNGKTVTGTKKNDVIVALGKGVKVSGLGGNDLICTKAAKSVDAGPGNDKVQFGTGKILGGLGNDTLAQTAKGGAAQVFGGAGNDTMKLITKGNLVDSGTGLDVLIVAPALLDFQTIVDRDGLTINGITPRIDAPKGAPTADISFDGDPGPVVFARTHEAYGFTSSDDEVAFGHVIPKNGRTLTSWSIDFGDGSIHSGAGGLPEEYPHSYLTDGNHVITATQKDSAGATTVRTITVSTSRGPHVGLGITSSNFATGDVTFNPGDTKAGAGATLTSWFVDFQDGTTASGLGAPPAAIPHNYPISDSNWRVVLYVTDDHGNATSQVSPYVSHNPPDANPHVYLAAVVTAIGITGHVELYGGNLGSASTDPAAPISAVNGTVFPGQLVYLALATANTDAETVDWGDGCIYVNDDGQPPHNIAQQGTTCATNEPSTEHRYDGPGARTITVTVHKSGGTPSTVSASIHLTVAARQTVAHLSRPGVVTQGPVTFSTAGTSFATGAHFWAFYPGDDSLPLYGTGAVPPTITHVYPSGVYERPYLIATDHYGITSESDSLVIATSSRARVVSFDAGDDGPGTGQWVPALVGTDASGDAALHFSGTFDPSLGARPQVATISYGDGASQTVSGFEDGSFGCCDSEYYDAAHAYSKTGDVKAVLSAKDTKGQVAAASVLVSVGGYVTLSSPDFIEVTATASQTTVPMVLSPGAVYGANSAGLGWNVYWDDGNLPNGDVSATAAQGAIPAAVPHAFPNPGSGNEESHYAQITVRNDHGYQTTRQVVVHVIGA